MIVGFDLRHSSHCAKASLTFSSLLYCSVITRRNSSSKAKLSRIAKKVGLNPTFLVNWSEPTPVLTSFRNGKALLRLDHAAISSCSCSTRERSSLWTRGGYPE